MKETWRSAVLHFLGGLNLDFCFVCADSYQVNISKLGCPVNEDVDTFSLDFKVGHINII